MYILLLLLARSCADSTVSLQRVDVLAESGLDVTHMSEPSPSVSQAQVTMFLGSVVAL